MQPIKDLERIWKAGIYARLSVDYHGQKNESIDTQMELAKEYIKQSKSMVLVDCYADLGKTGTNFEREGFDKLMADIRQHKINCVIVKDFSRFGRNYIETGNYLEKIFPFFNVRFISISDGYDSHQTQEENVLLAVNLKNIVNELYARECAEKVRAIKRAKLEQGCYVGGLPPYGYCAKWVDGKKILFPEAGSSDVVKNIYALFAHGNAIRKIICWLYEQGIHRPSEYRNTGHVYCKEGETLKQWPEQTIRSILTNQVYIGALAQLRVDEVLRIKHAHEPIIEEDMFYRISSKIEEKKKKELQKKGQPNDVLSEDIYKNLLYCGECGKKLKRTCTSNRKSYHMPARTYSYGCPNIQRIDSLKCDSHFISLNAINRIVQETLRKEFDLSEIRMKALVDFNQKQEEQSEKNLEKKKRESQKRIQGADMEMSSLYRQYKSGKIDKETFLELKANKEMEKNNWIKELSKQERGIQRIRKEADELNYFIRCLWKGNKSAALDSQVLHCLLQRINVYKDRRVEIILNFSKEQLK